MAARLSMHSLEDLRTFGPSDLRTFGPSELRTFGPSDLGARGERGGRLSRLGPSDLRTFGPRPGRLLFSSLLFSSLLARVVRAMLACARMLLARRGEAKHTSPSRGAVGRRVAHTHPSSENERAIQGRGRRSDARRDGRSRDEGREGTLRSALLLRLNSTTDSTQTLIMWRMRCSIDRSNSTSAFAAASDTPDAPAASPPPLALALMPSPSASSPLLASASSCCGHVGHAGHATAMSAMSVMPVVAV